ncbi:META domain protein [Rubripirellula obstinata]|uniref:META domain protein n=1 Tax=Rubripirellula obstinata TaxID=406547 RepID=A0A5B1CML7_9BACT|nr:META domain-containing protein [Rubripirellula obstinata]KAA1261531.1 META domain protein [Rubripirellula obstinata]
MRKFHIVLVMLACIQNASAKNPLPSWNDGQAKQSIITFVDRVTAEDSESFVPVDERIAVFDNDGTLWCEFPLPNQAAFALDEIKRMLPENPEWKDEPAVAGLISGDVASLKADHNAGLIKLLALTHAGITPDTFDSRVENWLQTAKHPRFDCSYRKVIYQPMLELLEYLRTNQFETWIVSGGGQDFMRVFAEETYGIPPQQIIGSYGKLKYELIDGKPMLTKTLDSLFVDDKEGKPVAIAQFIGRRPIACFGNSDGDQAMMEYTTIDNPRPSFGLIVHHTDADREYAYDSNPSSSGKLTTALEAAPQRGWTVVDMKQDWKTVFPDQADEGLSSLIGQWLVEDIAVSDSGNQGVVDRAQTTVQFSADGTASGNTCVNRYSGNFNVDGNKLTFGQLATTRMAGPAALMDQEQRFLKAIETVATYEFGEPGIVHFLDKEANRVMKLSKK